MYMTENQKIASAYRKMYESSPADGNLSRNIHSDANNGINESFFSFGGNNGHDDEDDDATTIFDHNEQKLIGEWQKISSNIKNEYIDNLIRYMAEYVANGRLNENEIKNLLYNSLSYSSTDKPYSVIVKLIENTKMRKEYGNRMQQEYGNGNAANGQSNYGSSYGEMNGYGNGYGINRQNRTPFRIIRL